jgi:hypothetical protein
MNFTAVFDGLTESAPVLFELLANEKEGLQVSNSQH